MFSALYAIIGIILHIITMVSMASTGISVVVNGRYHRETKRYFWLAALTTFCGALAFFMAGRQF